MIRLKEDACFYITLAKKHSRDRHKSLYMGVVVANLMCQLAWAMGSPETWADLILGISVRVFLDNIHI